MWTGEISANRRVKEGFYLVILRSSFDFDVFFKCVFLYTSILFETRNNFVGAHNYLYFLRGWGGMVTFGYERYWFLTVAEKCFI